MGIDTIIGVGRLGSRLGEEISKQYNTRYLSIEQDLVRGLLNPSILELRNQIHAKREGIISSIGESILFIGDLTEKVSIASIPLLSAYIKESKREVCSLITMPYSLQKNILYHAKQALEHIYNNSDYNIIIDKDALLQSSLDLTLEECDRIIDNAIRYISSILFSRVLESKDNLVALSLNNDIKDALKGALNMLYADCDPDKLEDTLIYIHAKKIKVGEIRSISDYMSDIFPNTRVSISVSENYGNGLLLLASTKTRFDRYDPLIKIEHNIDYGLDNTIRIGLPLNEMEL